MTFKCDLNAEKNNNNKTYLYCGAGDTRSTVNNKVLEKEERIKYIRQTYTHTHTHMISFNK